MDDKKLENKIDDEQLEEVSGGRRGTRGKAVGPKDTVKPVFTVGKNANDVTDQIDANGERRARPYKI